MIQHYVNNYRPISILSNLSKILEKLKCIHESTTSWIKTTVYDLQFGFRNKHSTNHALIHITETIRSAIDNKQFACGVFIDLQKAFGTVNHAILIGKLRYYGIRGTELSWFTTFIQDRSHTVSINGNSSNKIITTHGVPQGSVLGPLLFLLYINDLHEAIQHSIVLHFADDTNILTLNPSLKQLNRHINHDLSLS